MIVFKNKISTIEYDKKLKLITYNQHGIAKKDLIIDQLRAVIEFSETNSVTCIIADFRRLAGSFKSVFDFLNTEYYPIMKSRGLNYKAFIVSEDIINNHLANDLTDSLKQHKINAAVFSNTENALKWLIEASE